MATYTMQRGDSFVLNTQILNNGIPQNITGWRIIFTAKLYFSDADSAAISQLDNLLLGGVTIINALSGQIKIVMPSGVTQTFPDAAVTIQYDIKGQDTSSPPIVQTVESGTITVSPSVTRAI